MEPAIDVSEGPGKRFSLPQPSWRPSVRRNAHNNFGLSPEIKSFVAWQVILGALGDRSEEIACHSNIIFRDLPVIFRPGSLMLDSKLLSSIFPRSRWVSCQLKADSSSTIKCGSV
jgi:hypothetical protein